MAKEAGVGENNWEREENSFTEKKGVEMRGLGRDPIFANLLEGSLVKEMPTQIPVLRKAEMEQKTFNT